MAACPSSSISPVSTTGTGSIFDFGNFEAVLRKVEQEKCCVKSSLSVSPPKSLLIAMPSEPGEFSILIFLHGYLLYNTFYSQLLRHIASHGFIVIAPQLYNFAGPDSEDEISSTAAIINWLPEGLPSILPLHVKPNLHKLAVSGHSRGGKTSFALALRKSTTTLKLSALIGIDPVDGMDKGRQTPPPVLTYTPGSFDLNMPVMVIGSGLGEVKRNILFPPCAPKGVNHEDFFRECRGPAFHFVVKDYGHVDMLDDETRGGRGMATYCLCKNGESRGPMRRFVGGIVVAFLRAYLEGKDGDLVAVRDGKVANMPVELQLSEFRE